MTAKKKKQPRRVAPPNDEELAALVAALPAPLGAFTLVAAWSGLRLSEVADLRWGDVRPPLLVVRAGKGNKRRESVLLAPGADAIESVRPMIGGEPVEPYPDVHVFRNQNGRPWTRQSVNKHWLRAREAAGLERFVFHDTRKRLASYLLNRGASPMDVAVTLGHTDKYGRPNTKLVEQVYGHVDPSAALGRLLEVHDGA